MKAGARFSCVTLALCCALAVVMPGCASDGAAPRVLIIPRVGSYDMDYMLIDEVGVMLSMLDEAGVEAIVALPGGLALEGRTERLEADMALADVVVSDFDGVMLPCMAAGYERNDATVEIVREAVAAGVPVAAQFGSVGMLGEAGALDGREYAAREVLAVESGTYRGFGVVRDGDVITSGTCPYAARTTGRPDGTPELTRLFIDALD